MWFPATQEALDRNDESLRWAVNLPQVIFSVLLSHRLAALARRAGDAKAAAWQRTAMVLNAVLAAATVLAFASGADHLLPAIYAVAAGVVLLVIILLFAHADRVWAPGPSPDPAP